VAPEMHEPGFDPTPVEGPDDVQDPQRRYSGRSRTRRMPVRPVFRSR
jgi:hypothetical protein